ncbi:hypothetical protein HanRHA438_Chr01g0004421 [Helianthus annuus]|nr:hypothetical protein HanRHA438_Chr01g0004421 [Helianthus annuus]
MEEEAANPVNNDVELITFTDDFMLSSSSSYLDFSNSGTSTPVKRCGGGFECEFTAKKASKETAPLDP